LEKGGHVVCARLNVRNGFDIPTALTFDSPSSAFSREFHQKNDSFKTNAEECKNLPPKRMRTLWRRGVMSLLHWQTRCSVETMAEAIEGVAAVIDLITRVHNKYMSFQALKEENEKFRRTMLAVQSVLHDILSKRASLRMPLQMIEGAIRMGKKIMRKCSKRKNMLRIALMQPRLR
jgi:hypothetical protein